MGAVVAGQELNEVQLEQERVPGPSALDDYLFDLRGYLVVQNAIDQQQLAAVGAPVIPQRSPRGRLTMTPDDRAAVTS